MDVKVLSIISRALAFHLVPMAANLDHAQTLNMHRPFIYVYMTQCCYDLCRTISTVCVCVYAGTPNYAGAPGDPGVLINSLLNDSH